MDRLADALKNPQEPQPVALGCIVRDIKGDVDVRLRRQIVDFTPFVLRKQPVNLRKDVVNADSVNHVNVPHAKLTLDGIKKSERILRRPANARIDNVSLRKQQLAEIRTVLSVRSGYESNPFH
jgi:hypothetical protein